MGSERGKQALTLTFRSIESGVGLDFQVATNAVVMGVRSVTQDTKLYRVAVCRMAS